MAGEGAQSRLLFVITSSDIGGTESCLRELVSGLDPREFESVVCSLRPPGMVAQHLATAGTQVLTLGMSERPRIGELVAGIFQLARWIDTLNIDLVQSFLYRANALGGIAARLASRRPVIVSGQRSLNPLGGRRAALAARLTRRLPHRVIAVSAAVRTRLLEAEEGNADRVIIIENGVDTIRYAAGKRSRPPREWQLGPKDVVVGGVGRLSPEKGFAHLVEAIALARKAGVSLTLVLAGGGPERGSLERLARRLGVERYVRFLGALSDPQPLYRSLDIFALPSLEEGAPNALLEAMASGVPVVGTSVGGVPEIIEHDGCGVLVEAGSARSLADALISLAKAPALREKLGAAGAKRVRERFDTSRMVERYATLYRELLTSRVAV